MAFVHTDPPPPTWRLTAWLTTSPAQIPPDVLTILRGRLVVGVAPLIVAAFVGAALASLAILRVPTPAMLAWFCADLALTLVRLTTMLVMRHTLRNSGQRSREWLPLTDLYVLSSLLWCAQIGCGVGLSPRPSARSGTRSRQCPQRVRRRSPMRQPETLEAVQARIRTA